MKVIEEHAEKMKGMTCVEKTRYVLEFVLHEDPPLTKSKHWSRIYNYFLRNMHYQKWLESHRRSENNRMIREGKPPHKPTPRLRIPSCFDSQAEYRVFVAAGMRRLGSQHRRMTADEAAREGLRIRAPNGFVFGRVCR